MTTNIKNNNQEDSTETTQIRKISSFPPALYPTKIIKIADIDTSFNLFIDDLRLPTDREVLESGLNKDLTWTCVRNVQGAIWAITERGRMPDRIALDHDLGEEPFTKEPITIMEFLKYIAYEYWDGKAESIPEYTIHSANPVGRENIKAFMESWKKIANLP